jgi:hypothetical protein
LVLNLYLNRAEDHRRHLVVSFNNNDYAKRKGRTPVSAKVFKKAFDGLVAAKLVKVTGRGFFNHNTGTGFRTRCKGTKALLDVIEKANISPFMVKVRARRELVELRSALDAKGEYNVLKWPAAHIQEKRQMEAPLRDVINPAMEQAFICLRLTDLEFDELHARMARKRPDLAKERKSNPGEFRIIHYHDKALYRVFHDGDTKLGGRFVGAWYQNIPRNYRERIWIAKPGAHPAPTREIDFSEMQPRMLYAKAHVPCLCSPYEIYPADPAANAASRDAIKILLLPMLNAEDRGKALGAARNEVRDRFADWWPDNYPGEAPPMSVDQMGKAMWPGCKPLHELINDIEAAHRCIIDRFYNPRIGKELMYDEARIAEAVMVRMIRSYGVPALPIHDSFVVRKGYEDMLEQFMEDAFRELFPNVHDVPTKSPRAVLGRWPTEDDDTSANSVWYTYVEDWERSIAT